MQFIPHVLVFGTLFVLCLANKEIQNLTHASSKCGAKEKAFTLLDVSKDFINKAKNLYPNCVEDELSCGQKEKSSAFLDVAMNLITEVKNGYPTCNNTECPKQVERPMDCSDILRSGKNESGIYTIWPKNNIFTNKSLAVYCDMDTDGGGWTVIQRRGKFSTPKDYFYKDWESYKNGFGNLTEEFWLGNENIYAISTQAIINKPYKVRFDMKDASGKAGYAEYSTFWIENEAASYTLHIEGYKGAVGDSMTRHNGMKFSTKDRNNDPIIWRKSCAVEFPGGWWYHLNVNIGNCIDANLNGIYQPGVENKFLGCVWFYPYKWISISAVEIKIRA